MREIEPRIGHDDGIEGRDRNGEDVVRLRTTRVSPALFHGSRDNASAALFVCVAE